MSNESNTKLIRLLHAAARADDEPLGETPFGFDTRVVALWRASGKNGNGNAIARLVRRVAIAAAALILVSTAAVVREYQQARDQDEPMTNEFAIADSAIQDEIMQ